MDLRDFLRSTRDNPAERERVAASAGTSVAYLWQLAGGHSRASADMAVRIEQASGGRITREELRPDLFVRNSAAA